ncbi:MAG: helix-turn-helix domain-containing protein [Bacteroidota bacterium]
MDNKFGFQKPMLTFKEACEYCSIPESSFYKHTMNKNVPYYKPFGKKIYFKREELDEWLMTNRFSTREELERKATKMALG